MDLTLAVEAIPLHYVVDPGSPLAGAASFPDAVLHLLAGIARLFGISA